MPQYLMAVYTINTVIVNVEADSREEAVEKFDKGGEDLNVLNIPETTYSAVFEPFIEPEQIE